jgi:hypothetical protein
MALYDNILKQAATKDLEISKRGFQEFSGILAKRKEHIQNKDFKNRISVIEYAIENSKNLVEIFEDVLEKTQTHKVKRANLENALIRIMEQEKTDQILLSRYLKDN